MRGMRRKTEKLLARRQFYNAILMTADEQLVRLILIYLSNSSKL